VIQNTSNTLYSVSDSHKYIKKGGIKMATTTIQVSTITFKESEWYVGKSANEIILSLKNIANNCIENVIKGEMVNAESYFVQFKSMLKIVSQKISDTKESLYIPLHLGGGKQSENWLLWDRCQNEIRMIDFQLNSDLLKYCF